MKAVSLLFIVILLSYVLKAQVCCNFTPGAGVGGPDPNPNTAFSIALGDIDGDGDADMVAHSAYKNTYVYKSNNGVFTLSQTLTYSNDDSWQYGLNLADIDGDGDLDLITTPQWSWAKMFIYKNNGSGTFSVWQTINTNISAYNKALGDVDGDGDVDIVLVSAGSGSPLRVYKNNGNGVFSLYNSFAGEGGRTVVLGDVDNDGDLDAVVATMYYGTAIRLYRNDGNGNFTMDTQVIGDSNMDYHSVALGDLNGDGKLDIVAGTGSYNFQIFKNLGNGYYTLMQTYKWLTSWVSYHMQIRIADMDGDGKRDIISSCYSGGIMVWRCLNNDFEFAPCYRSSLASYGHGMDIGDINADGKLDIVGSCANDYLAYTFFNNGGTSGTPVSASNNSPVCSGQSVQLFAQPSGASYQWYDPQNNYLSSAQNPIISNITINDEGNYTVAVSNSNCYNTAQTYVDVYESPVVNAGNDEVVSQGTVLNFNATVSGGSGNYIIQWEPSNMVINPNSLNTQTMPINQSMYFVLYVTDLLSNCTTTDTIYVTVTGTALSVNIYASSTQFCLGNSLNLIAMASGGTGNYTYTWSSNPQGFSGQGASVNVSPLENTTYYVTVDDGINTATDTIYIEVLQPPVVNLWSNSPVCPYEDVTLYASDAYSYLWSGPYNFSSTEQNPVVGNLPSGSYVYYLTVTDIYGCSSTASTTVLVNNQSAALGILSPDSLNLSQSQVLNFYGINTGNVTSWTWIFPDTTFTTQNGSYTFDSTGTYNIILIVENNAGCTDTVEYTYLVYNTTFTLATNFNSNIKIYPNPVTNFINIVSDEAILKAEILSIDGKVITSYSQPTNKTIYVKGLSNGMYLLKVQTASSQKIIKFNVNN